MSDWVRIVVKDLWKDIYSIAERRSLLSPSEATAPLLAEKILKEAGRPLHFSVIAERTASIRLRNGLGALADDLIPQHGKIDPVAWI